MTTNTADISYSQQTIDYADFEKYLTDHFDKLASMVQASVRCDEEGRIFLMIGDEEFVVEKLTGDPKIIISVAMRAEFLGHPITRKIIQLETGHTISRSLVTVLRANLFMNSLSDFAEVKDDSIIIHRTAKIHKNVLLKINPKPKDYVKTF